MKQFIALLVLLLLFGSLIIAVYLVAGRTNIGQRAAGPGTLSLENSYLFASPLMAKAGGAERITVTGFVLSDQGLGMPDYRTTLYSTPALDIVAVRDTTDQKGMVVYEIVSPVPGTFDLWALVGDSGKIQQTVKVTFTE